MKKNMSVTIRGKKSTWNVNGFMPDEQIEAMREDGIELSEVINTIPVWVVEIGLLRPWCFLEDILNFRNPFEGWKK